jgi:hypothetical protein
VKQQQRMQRTLVNEYVWKRQTLAQIAERTGRSHVWVKKQLDAALERERVLLPRSTSIAADMTFWGRGYGVLVFRSPLLKKNLWWTASQVETPFVYSQGLVELQKQGWTITGAVIDGKRGVAQVFERQGIPVQYCQFHQMQTVTKYLTRHPKTEAGQSLRSLAITLPHTTEDEFREQLRAWRIRYQVFIDERSPAPQKKRGWEYTHRKLRATHRSLLSNLARLFTYQKYPELGLPNTTNTLDGMFSQIKNRLAVHRGLRKDRRFKIISEILKGAHD